ncbi:UDP-N-acetylmuramate--L-alanine ligase [Roseivirga thermotolerans]|uniref:UDP-N-acetylmuramate--L-alanine ligase n=1 Tax=Roseivirga thermotolerans TaxID=1758176 RepID=A0ABQ3I571_9BACT|nr:UDP-N-acetylmuramate--L-alanine ligase [Roseivirga thermotolerans]GHE65454.1 UDP-N-acetylmuramate--L-alanine ligase [Roseivirga thermotolerans]
MKLEKIHSVYFVGIGGIGMSALARWFKHNGKRVSGYDRTSTELTTRLIQEGIEIHFDDNIDLIDAEVKANPEGSLIIYTPAIPKDHSELNWLKGNGFEVLKRSQVLGIITQNMRSVAVAGTHGKTTTSSMVVHLLKESGFDVAGFLGGISANYDTNMILNETSEAIAVIEADEFDRSFLTLHPEWAVVTSADADHLDIYGHKDVLKDSFRDFIKRIKQEGKLFVKNELATELVSGHELNHEGYALSEASITAENIRFEEASFIFDYKNGEKTIEGIRLNVPGYHNVENMLAAISVSRHLGAKDESIKKAVESYRGVKRRFEFIIKRDDLVFIDDYAHHPVEIAALLKSVKDLFAGKKITVVFQPHLFSRTRDFAQEFSESLSLADEVILLDIYPARELPMEGVNSGMLIDGISAEKKMVSSKESLIDHIKAWQPQVLLTVGAGDIDKLVQPLKRALS